MFEFMFDGDIIGEGDIIGVGDIIIMFEFLMFAFMFALFAPISPQPLNMPAVHKQDSAISAFTFIMISSRFSS